MACGDPACDLMMAWNTFDNKSRELFKKKIEYDNETWMRGMGWTLWKALLEFSSISQSQARDWQDQKKVIDAVINDYNIAHT
jgi:aminoglycoside phosphotransferase (APT) family kinase protein